jgi:hypothetical protein
MVVTLSNDNVQCWVFVNRISEGVKFCCLGLLELELYRSHTTIVYMPQNEIGLDICMR